jgi:tripartite-type tricarboxylate transporter receptor subunit TctC
VLIAPRLARAADFYQGRTLTMIVGFAPGGGVGTTAAWSPGISHGSSRASPTW